MSELAFLPGMAKRLGYYVDVLRDPTDGGRLSYVGKGVGDRVHQHAALAKIVSPAEGPDNGIVRAVYTIDKSVGWNGWEDAPDATDRRRFTDSRALDLEEAYVWRDARAWLPNGSRFPFRYVNC